MIAVAIALEPAQNLELALSNALENRLSNLLALKPANLNQKSP